MPTHSGPNTAAKNNIVFSYDIGDVLNSYKGEPTTNLIGNFVNTYNEDYWVRATNYYQLEATAYVVQDESAPGGAYTYVTGNTSNTNAQLFWSAGNTICNEFGQQVSVSAWLRGSGQVRLIAYDDTTGYKSGPAITLTDQWTYHKFSTTFGSGGTQANHWVGVREITTGEYVHVAQMKWERKSHSTQYVRGTRSATQGLLPLIGNASIDLSNISFDSNAQITFDGTNDIINTNIFSGRNPSTDPFTVEAIVKSDITSGTRMWVDAGGNGTNQRFYSALIDGTTSATGIQSIGWADSIPNHTNWSHQVIVMDGQNAKAYADGIFKYQIGYTSYTLPGGLNIGGRSGYPWLGQIPIFKVYDRALSDLEVKQNYNQYKSRFNLS